MIQVMPVIESLEVGWDVATLEKCRLQEQLNSVGHQEVKRNGGEFRRGTVIAQLKAW